MDLFEHASRESIRQRAPSGADAALLLDEFEGRKDPGPGVFARQLSKTSSVFDPVWAPGTGNGLASIIANMTSPTLSP